MHLNHHHVRMPMLRFIFLSLCLIGHSLEAQVIGPEIVGIKELHAPGDFLIPAIYFVVKPPHAERFKNWGSATIQIEKMNIGKIENGLIAWRPDRYREFEYFNDENNGKNRGKEGRHVSLIMADGKEWRYAADFAKSSLGEILCEFPLAYYPINQPVTAIRFYLGPFLSREIPVENLRSPQWPKITAIRPDAFNASITLEKHELKNVKYHLVYREDFRKVERKYWNIQYRLLTTNQASQEGIREYQPDRGYVQPKLTIKLHFKDEEAAFAKLPKEVQEGRRLVYIGDDLKLYVLNGFEVWEMNLGRRGKIEFVPPQAP